MVPTMRAALLMQVAGAAGVVASAAVWAGWVLGLLLAGVFLLIAGTIREAEHRGR
jgi:hypothetical protein